VYDQVVQAANGSDFAQQLERELEGNVLPFWMAHTVDKVHGGFYGAVTHDLQVHNEVPRSAILCARILWTYAAAHRRLGAAEYLVIAEWAYDYLTRVFWDQDYGGLSWDVDRCGVPVTDRKHHYAQAFGIYGLAEYYRATREPQSLALAQELFHLLEEHAFDPVHQGYTEGSSRQWRALADMRLSDRDLNCRKTMNTMLHILEAYTNLMRVWDDAHLRAQQRSLVGAFQHRIFDHQTGHFKLFFDNQWWSLSGNVSYGHDIEGSWLLWEAAEAQGDASLKAQLRESAVRLAAYSMRAGRKAWWMQTRRGGCRPRRWLASTMPTKSPVRPGLPRPPSSAGPTYKPSWWIAGMGVGSSNCTGMARRIMPPTRPDPGRAPITTAGLAWRCSRACGPMLA
jgi:mannobiose 2-epimerase